MKGRLFQCLEQGIRHVRGHPIRRGENTDAAPAFVGPVGELPLHQADLLHFKCLTLRFQKQYVGMKEVFNLPARSALIASIPPFGLFLAVECLGELKSDPLLSDAFVSPEEVAVNDLVALDRPLKPLDGSRMA